MSIEPETFPSFFELIKEALGPALRPGAKNLLDACDDKIIFEFPYAPDGTISRLEGKAAITEYLPKVGKILDFDDLHLDTVHAADDGKVFVLEFTCAGRGLETGLPYNQKYISLIYVEDGLITRYRDYWNPQILVTAIGGAAALPQALKGDS